MPGIYTVGADASWAMLCVPEGQFWRCLALYAETVHTSTMTQKNAAFLALIGTLVLTIILAADFINSVLAVVRGLVPAMALLRSLVYLVASVTLTVFSYAFNR
jgi:hypothetical protein